VDGGLAKSGPGDTVFIDGGTYDESFILGAGRSPIHQEFGAASDPPAIVNGGGMPAIEVPNGGFAGTVQGLTIRGSEGSLKAFGPVTVVGNTFDEGDGTYTSTQGSLHLEDDAATFNVTGNHFFFNGGGSSSMGPWSLTVTTELPDLTHLAKKQKLKGKVKLTASSPLGGQLVLSGGVKTKTVTLQSGVTTLIKAKVKPKLRKRLAAAIERKGKAKVKVNGSLTDAIGDTDAATAKIKVK
jgi:hypothetical protein